MLHNVVTGCSSAMNRSLVDIALPFPEQAIVHDWWIAMVAAVTGKIAFDNKPLTQYRQHNLNAIGLKPLYSRKNVKRLLLPGHISKEFAKIVDQNLALKSRFGNLLSPQMHEFMDKLPVGGRQLLKAAKIAGVKPQAWSRSVRFWLASTYIKANTMSAHVRK